MLNIVLVHPEIPNNTGNIGRLCVGTNCRLHLIHPLGFEITDKQVKRSGLDYWQHLEWYEYENVADWITKVEDRSRVFLFSSHGKTSYLEVEYQDEDWLVFGRESVGLSDEVLKEFENYLTIPTSGKVRSYNLANAVTFSIGEALRQINGVEMISK
ncbi:tRNA (cytidine(34)-2'-O)-methyltransferase [Aquimarina rhabdastrellae]